MNNFKKTLFVLFAFTTQTTLPSFSRKALMTTVALAATLKTAECATAYDQEATQRLWHAIVVNDLIAAQKAIDEGANPNGTPEESFLVLATKCNLLASVKFLIFHKADVNARCKFLQQTPLIIACIHGRPKIVNALLEAKADYALEDKNCMTALEWAETDAELYKNTEREIAYQECIDLIQKRMK